MKTNQQELRVGFSPLNHRLYAGQVDRVSGCWQGERHDVTETALLAVAQKVMAYTTVFCTLPNGQVVALSAQALPAREVSS